MAGGTGLQQQHLVARIRGQPVGDGRAGRPGADDDVVIRLHRLNSTAGLVCTTPAGEFPVRATLGTIVRTNQRALRAWTSRKTAIVTGAASGIGLGIATALAEAGAVVMADIRRRRSSKRAWPFRRNKRVMVRIDVTQGNRCSMLWQRPSAISASAIACNNAGVPMHGVPLADVTPADSSS